MVKIQKQIPPASAALGVGMTKLNERKGGITRPKGRERERDLEEQGRNLEKREETY